MKKAFIAYNCIMLGLAAAVTFASIASVYAISL